MPDKKSESVELFRRSPVNTIEISGAKATTEKGWRGRATQANKAFPSLSERRSSDRQAMTKAILDAAEAVILQEGLHELSLQAVATQVGIKPPSLYEYFGSKADIYDALFMRGSAALSQLLFKAMNSADNFSEACLAIFKGFDHFAQKYPHLYQLTVGQAVKGYTPSVEAVGEVRANLAKGMAHLKHLLEKEGGSHRISSGDAVLMMEMLIYGITAKLFAEEHSMQLDRAAHERLVPSLVTLVQEYGGNANAGH